MTHRKNISRLLWRTLAWTALALGAAGTVLPLLPTTPFLLIAAWAAPKGSPRLAHWLNQHRVFGPVLQAWHSEGAVPERAKWTAVGLLATSWSILWFLNTRTVVLYFTGTLFILVTVFLITRPSPSRSKP